MSRPHRPLRAIALPLLSILVLAVAVPAAALEREAVPMSDGRNNDGWASGFTCSVSYYNTCTGWLWTWSGWSPSETIGMVIESCWPTALGSVLNATNLYAWSGAPSGYGFTGTVSISTVDENDCPAVTLASTPLLPASGNNVSLWGLWFPNNGKLVVTYQHSDQAGNPTPLADPTVWPTDHPAAGPTGPAACGTCYPSPRTTHSYDYGTTDSVLCPGSPLNDGVCNAEFLLWAAAVTGVVDYVEPNSWAKVKDLYR